MEVSGELKIDIDGQLYSCSEHRVPKEGEWILTAGWVSKASSEHSAYDYFILAPIVDFGPAIERLSKVFKPGTWFAKDYSWFAFAEKPVRTTDVINGNKVVSWLPCPSKGDWKSINREIFDQSIFPDCKPEESLFQIPVEEV